MNGLLSSFKKRRRQRLYQTLIQDRTHLTDYERKQLIPEIRSRLEILKEYVNGIVTLCRNLKGTPLFAQNLELIINPQALESPMGDGQSLAQRYFNDVESQSQKEYIDDIDKILKEYENIEDFQTLGLFLNEVNFLCSSIMAVKTNLFLSRIQGYPVVVNRSTGETIAAKPAQYDLTIEPFQITIQNMESVSKATSESIHHWHEQTIVMKARFLELLNTRITRRNNAIILAIQLLTIILAVSVSAFFLTASDPFELVKENNKLKKFMETREQQIELLNSRLEFLEKEIQSKKLIAPK